MEIDAHVDVDHHHRHQRLPEEGDKRVCAESNLHAPSLLIRSRLKSAPGTDYFSQQYEGSLNWQLPANFYFSGNLTYIINSQRANGYNKSIPLCNASLSKQFLHFNRGELKLSVSDLFNENVGISRSTNQNYIEDSRITNLQRFFLLSFTYSLSKNGLSAGAKTRMFNMRTL